MASWWQYILFYLGFKSKQKQIEREQQPEALTDEVSFIGDDEIPPGKSNILKYEVHNPSIITVDIESLSGHVLDVSIVDKQNLARMDPEAVKTSNPAFQAITEDEEQLQGNISGGEWAVVVYNPDESEAASAYLNVRISRDGAGTGGAVKGTGSSVLAGFLSLLIPGAGQLYNREIVKAIAGFFAVPTAYFLLGGVGLAINFAPVILLGVIVHFGVIYDAYRS
jgi:TM2 domain-containing membrane protein YozV